MTLLPNSLRSLALTAITAVACSAQSTAPAAVTSSSRNYTRIDAGVSLVNNIDVEGEAINLKAGPFVALAYGIPLSAQSALEGEISHQTNNFDTKDLSDFFDAKAAATSFLANWSTNLDLGGGSKLALGLGAGVSVVRLTATVRLFRQTVSESSSSSLFTGQARALWVYPIGTNSNFVAGYRFKYMNASNLDFEGVDLEVSKLYTNTFSAGFSFSF